MKIDKVRKLKPIERLVYFIQEREAIRLKREGGENPPFTDDEILQLYRFCNVRRADDTVSKWLQTNWYTPYKDHEDIVPAVALARFINKPDSLEEITSLVFGSEYNTKAIKKTLRLLKLNGATVFNGAYIVRGNDGEDKISSVVDYYVQPLVDSPPIIHRGSMELTHGELMQYHGMGSFMAGQIVADLRWAMTGTWLDKMDWAPIGPGSAKGMNVTIGREPKFNLKQKQFLEELKELWKTLKKNLPKSITSRLELHDIQNCCCEGWKYHKAIMGLGFPKRRYYGV